ncbi:hypothetical protein AVEN_7515-1 [Araneus ventricosus]|uniref:Uncharacterized protein n=1 Tax=Araneus ventricosus TaxID=182803 RepID=A0A4Y2NEY7_ARAVE|nr:hypothetical protein AVEN_7515-1 [Araneus ventricosus]
MSLKIHFLHSHLEFYRENLGSVVRDEHGERFHQDILNMGARYQGKWNPKITCHGTFTIGATLEEEEEFEFDQIVEKDDEI